MTEEMNVSQNKNDVRVQDNVDVGGQKMMRTAYLRHTDRHHSPFSKRVNLDGLRGRFDKESKRSRGGKKRRRLSTTVHCMGGGGEGGRHVWRSGKGRSLHHGFGVWIFELEKSSGVKGGVREVWERKVSILLNEDGCRGRMKR